MGAGDVNGDGCPDLYFVDYDNNLEDRLLVNREVGGVCQGVFDDKTDELICQFATGTCFNNSVFGTAAQIVDLNGDGCNDIVKAQNTKVTVAYQSAEVIGGNVNCLAKFETTVNLASGDPYMFAAEDVNRDTHVDIYFVRDTQDTYRINQGGGNFSIHIPVANSSKTDDFGGNVRLVDLDGDELGTLDVVVSDVDVDIPGCTRQLAILQTEVDPLDTLNVTVSDPFDTFQCPWNTNGTYDTAVLDIDGDLKPDLWSGTCDGNHLFFQTATFDDCNANAVPDACEGPMGACCDGFTPQCIETIESCCASPFDRFHPNDTCATIFPCPTILGPQPGG